MTKINSKGLTLIELLFVLAIIVVITLSVVRLYQTTENNRRVTDAANMVLAVYQAGGQSESLDTGKDLISIFVNNGLLPSDFSTNQNTINPWGGKLNADAPTSTSLRVALTAVPNNLCNNLAAKFNKMSNATPSSCGTSSGTGTFKVTFDMNLK